MKHSKPEVQVIHTDDDPVYLHVANIGEEISLALIGNYFHN